MSYCFVATYFNSLKVGFGDLLLDFAMEQSWHLKISLNSNLDQLLTFVMG
jgi:hypothetical protein